MSATKTRAIRVSNELDRIIQTALAKRNLRGERVKSPRLTLAMARQYRKYPNLIKELEDSDLK